MMEQYDHHVIAYHWELVFRIILGGGSLMMHPDDIKDFAPAPAMSWVAAVRGVPIIPNRYLERGKWYAVAKDAGAFS